MHANETRMLFVSCTVEYRCGNSVCYVDNLPGLYARGSIRSCRPEASWIVESMNIPGDLHSRNILETTSRNMKLPCT